MPSLFQARRDHTSVWEKLGCSQIPHLGVSCFPSKTGMLISVGPYRFQKSEPPCEGVRTMSNLPIRAKDKANQKSRAMKTEGEWERQRERREEKSREG